MNLRLLLAALTASARAANTGLRVDDNDNGATGAPPVRDSVSDDAVTSVVTDDDGLLSGTVLRADVLREYAKYDQGEHFDLLQHGFHIQANDLEESSSYDEAQAGGEFSLSGHMIVEAPDVDYHIGCPACSEDCMSIHCSFMGHSDVTDKESTKNEEGAMVLAPRRKLEGEQCYDCCLSEDLPPGGECCPRGDPCCFSLESIVDVKGKGPTPIKDLKIGDMILSDDQGTYSKFYSQGHYLEAAATKFLRIFTDVAAKPLEASPGHMIFTDTRVLPIPASAIKVGEVVRTIHGPARVIAVEKITREGLYSPITLSGTIVVDGVVASANVQVAGFEGTDPGWVYFGGAKVVHWHTLVHAAHAPHRLFCGRLSACSEPLDDEGFTPYHRFLLGLAHKAAEKQSFLYSALVLLAVVLAMAPFYAVELLIENTFVVLAGGCVAAGLWCVLSNVQVKVKSA